MLTIVKVIKRACLLGVIALLGCVNVGNQPSPPFLLTVNGEGVTQEEYCWFMQQERAAVFRHVNAAYDLDPDRNFWDQDCDGITPRDMLLNSTTERVVREKVEQALFKEFGLVEDIRHAAFLAHLEQLNQQRQKAVDEGQVIYGPVQYTPLQYYGHWKATMQLRAKEKLREKTSGTSDDLDAEYNRLLETRIQNARIQKAEKAINRIKIS